MCLVAHKLQLNEPSQFITGALQLLVNRDHPKDAHSDPSRRLGPQLLENFVDIRHWAQEYFRTRHKMQNVEGDVPIVRFRLCLAFSSEQTFYLSF